MVLAWLMAALAGPQVLLVTTPGVTLDTYVPLIQALREGDVTVETVVFPCAGDGDDYRDKIRRQAGDQQWIVVAHGLGATLALQSGVRADRYVLLAPVLDVVPGPALQPLIDTPITGVLRLDHGFGEPALQGLLLGEWKGQLGCASSGWAREVQQWMKQQHIPMDLSAVAAPVWMGIGLLDEVAVVEATVPASRALPNRTLVRLGVARMDPKDYRHFDLLADMVPVRAAVRAVLEGK